MKGKLTSWMLGVGLVAGLILLGGLGAIWPQLVGANGPLEVLGPTAVVDDAITYQGYLTDDMGNPLDGSYTMRFQIYNEAAGGSLLYDSGSVNVSVNGGLFNVRLAISDDIFNGEELWVAQTVSGELLTPRQELLPTALAHTLRPGAIIKGTASAVTNNYTLEVHQNNDTGSFNRGAITGQTTTGNAIYGLADNGRAVYGQTQDGYAVYGFDGGSTPNRGYAGYFYSTNGIGVYGYSNGDRSDPNIYAPGVYGQSNRGVGVYGRGDTSNSNSFFNEGGYFEGGKGLYARGTDPDAQLGYGARIFSSQYRGLYVQGNAPDYDAYFASTGGISTYGIVDRSGAGQSLAINLGTAPIQPGDLVAIVGVAPSPETGEPLLGVAAVNSSNQQAVIGVAKVGMSARSIEFEDGDSYVDFASEGGVISADGYLVIITDGLAPAVNVSSLTRSPSWEIGEKIALTSGGQMTAFSAAAEPTEVVVIGKVAGPVDPDTGTIPLFIDID